MTDRENRDLLYELLWNAFLFAFGKYDGKLRLNDPVAGEECLAEKMFAKAGKRWQMRSDSIPGDPHIKAIAVNDAGIFLETSPVDEARLADIFGEAMWPTAFDRRLRRITSGNACLATITEAAEFADKGLAPRCLWVIPYKKLSMHGLELAISAADIVYGANAYLGDGFRAGEASDPAAASERPELRLDMSMIQTLEIEQRPELSLEIEDRMDQIMTQRQEIQGIMALQQRILQMRESELVAYVAEVGAEKALRAIVFTLAGRVKTAVALAGRDIDWKQARRIARQLVYSGGKK
jgi:hypothetical protein